MLFLQVFESTGLFLSAQTFKKVNELFCNVMQQTSNPRNYVTRNQKILTIHKQSVIDLHEYKCFYSKDNSE